MDPTKPLASSIRSCGHTMSRSKSKMSLSIERMPSRPPPITLLKVLEIDDNPAPIMAPHVSMNWVFTGCGASNTRTRASTATRILCLHAQRKLCFAPSRPCPIAFLIASSLSVPFQKVDDLVSQAVGVGCEPLALSVPMCHARCLLPQLRRKHPLGQRLALDTGYHCCRSQERRRSGRGFARNVL